ncbi:MAG: hypothetical protein INF12_14705 [Methylobacterium sp.]|nr:hypothetical protein [Methylobacterium sp.]
MRSPLGRMQPKEPLTPEEIKKFAAKAWHDRRGLWIPDGYSRNEIEREFFEALGTELYGRRK